MRLRFWGLLAILGAISGGASFTAQPAQAGGYCSDMVLTCENGRNYPLCPIAVSDEGEIVTGHLVLGPGRDGVAQHHHLHSGQPRRRAHRSGGGR